MPLALVSDVHGNDVALAAVAAELERLGLERVVCLGDVAQGGAQPAEALDRLAALGWQVVLGNADDFLLELPAASPEPLTPELLAVREWSLSRLEERHREQIRSFAATLEIELDGGRALCAFHGSPGSYDDVVLPETPDAEAESLLGGVAADLLAGGHTHLQWARRIGGALYVNPGSVGAALDRRLDPAAPRSVAVAEYGIVTGAGVEFRSVRWELEAYVEAALASGRPGAASLRDRWRA